MTALLSPSTSVQADASGRAVQTDPQPPTRARRPTDTVLAGVVWGSAVALLAVLVLLTRTVAWNPQSLLTSALSQALVLIVGLVTLGAVFLSRRCGRLALVPHLVVAALSLLSSGVLALALAKTPFGLGGLAADQSFRTAAMTRFSLTAAPVDFGYSGHGTFIPPLWYWLAGRTAAFSHLVGLDLAGWQLMKWWQILTAFAVPALGFLFWRRVVSSTAAALVVVLAVLAVPDPVKGDEWLSLVVMLPWWLHAFGGVSSRARAWPAWLHGVVAGLMLSLYTAFFLPAALATAAVGVHELRSGRGRALLIRWSVIGGVGLVVWSWVWVPAVYERLTGPPYQLFQLRWFGDTSPVPTPVEISPVGLIAFAGLLGLVWWAPRSRLFGRMAVFVAAIVVVLVVGLVATAAGHPILVQKTYPLLRTSLVAAAVLTGVQALGVWRPRWGSDHGRAVLRVLMAAVTAVAITLGLSYVRDDVRGSALTLAYREPDPSGRPASGARPTRASADQVAAVLGDDRGQVVLSGRYDLFALDGYHNFNQFTANYAHPHAQYLGRRDLIRRLGGVDDPQTMAALLRGNRFQPIDALVLQRSSDGSLSYGYRELDFPNATRPVTVTFDRAAFADPTLFEVVDLRGWTVIRPR